MTTTTAVTRRRRRFLTDEEAAVGVERRLAAEVSVADVAAVGEKDNREKESVRI